MSDLDSARVDNGVRSMYAARLNGAQALRDITAGILALDDARARAAGLICTGDGVTVDWVRYALAGLWPAARRNLLDDLSPELRARIEDGEP